MKNFRKFKTQKLIVIAIVAIVATIFEAKFIVDSINYVNFSIQLKCIEKDANSGVWTKNGYKHWTDSQIKAYNETLKAKSNFIENSDFAMYLYHAGFSSTGKCFRIIAFVVILFLLLCTLNVLYTCLKILHRRFKRYTKRLKRYYKKSNNTQKDQG